MITGASSKSNVIAINEMATENMMMSRGNFMKRKKRILFQVVPEEKSLLTESPKLFGLDCVSEKGIFILRNTPDICITMKRNILANTRVPMKIKNPIRIINKPIDKDKPIISKEKYNVLNGNANNIYTMFR